MGDMGLAGAYGAEGAAEALRQLIKDRLAQQQQTFTNNRLTANDKMNADLHAEQMRSLQENRASTQQAALEGEAAKGVSGLSVNQSIPAPMMGRLRGTMQAANIAENPPLAQPPNMPDMMQPDIVPGQQPGAVWKGTDAQRTADEDKQKMAELMNDPNTTPQVKSFIRMRGIMPKGENIPYQLITEPNGPPKSANGAEEDQRFEKIGTATRLGQPVSPEDRAWAATYRERKTLGPVASSGFADARLDKSENFAEAQAGRKELTDKVEKPYQDAAAQAATLRDIVTSAKAGNKFAAAQQPLEATLATVRQAGLNRINAQELGVSANAGSLWDRIQGAMGKQVAGQPMDPELQQNLLDYANVLEKAAHKRYLTGHQAITTRYGLKDEKPLAAPTGGSASITVTAPDGSVHPFDTQAQADAFKQLAGIK